MVGQVTGQFLMKRENPKRYLQQVGEERDHFQYSAIHHIPRGDNQEVDGLVKAASGQEEVPLPDYVVTWTIDDILNFLQEGILPNDRVEAQKVRNWAARFTLVEGILYKRGYVEPLLSFISDNGQQFDCSHYREWCSELKIKVKYSYSGHPQANGQVEATNKMLLNILKKKLGPQKGEWPDELPSTLWAYQTSERTTTGETNFSLVYGMKAVIPAEVAIPTYRVQQYDPDRNSERLRESLDFLEERREDVVR
ncbi:uncharacterized protein LOC118347692 [Juglans regia]|uniref:Uncharacterized protein LOC118347692 n=1 Tax=Juglans regia TaxID=51240 RepID=A0A6P9EHK3_JUGRE|nr:uncharacterized protein LOC118347692 [Juglans regia]